MAAMTSSLPAGFRRLGLPAGLMCALAALAAFPAGARAQDSRRKQEITFGAIAARTVDAPPFEVAARASSGLPLSLEIAGGPAALDGRKLKLTGEPGLVIVRASQEGNAEFLPAVAEVVFEVLPRPRAPVIVSQPAGMRAEIGEPFTLSVSASGEPEPALQWRKDGAAIAGAVQRSLSIPAASPSDSGAYDVVATNASGSAVSERARVAVVKRRQSISFQPAGPGVAGQPVSLNASATSGLSVQYEIVSGQAILNGTVLTSPGGAVTVRALQAGDASYEAAMPVTQTIFVGPAPGQLVP